MRLPRGILLSLALLSMALPAQAAEKLSVVLDWFVNPDHGPLVIARERGFFAAQDLEVTLIAPADPNDPPKLVAAGRADLAITYQPQLHVQVAEGLPLVRVGTLVATPLNTLLVLADGIVLLPGADAHAVEVLRALPQPFTASEARQALGSSRRVVLPLLDHLDRTGRTRREPDDRRRVV